MSTALQIVLNLSNSDLAEIADRADGQTAEGWVRAVVIRALQATSQVRSGIPQDPRTLSPPSPALLDSSTSIRRANIMALLGVRKPPPRLKLLTVK